jgi:tetratricopeptide (TPR) repeat protein
MTRYKYYILTLLLLGAAACNSSAPVAVQSNENTASNAKLEKRDTAIAHSLEKQTPPDASNSGGKSKWTQGGDPIDTAAYDKAIKTAEADLIERPGVTAVQKAVGEAYFKRAEALKDARQYASALGDYRRALKYDPSNADAQKWIDQIIMIYDSLGRESPKEGEEPPPLSSKK